MPEPAVCWYQGSAPALWAALTIPLPCGGRNGRGVWGGEAGTVSSWGDNLYSLQHQGSVTLAIAALPC